MILVAVAMQFGTPTATLAPNNPLKDYLLCAQYKAIALLPSGEPADVIAGVAQRGCEAQIDAAASFIQKKSRDDHVIADQDPRLLAAVDQRSRADLLEQLRIGARETATDAVVKVRAAAHDNVPKR